MNKMSFVMLLCTVALGVHAAQSQQSKPEEKAKKVYALKPYRQGNQQAGCPYELVSWLPPEGWPLNMEKAYGQKEVGNASVNKKEVQGGELK